MIRTLLTHKKTSGLVLAFYLLVLLTGELLSRPPVTVSVRLAVVVSLLNYPVLIWIYDYGIGDQLSRSFTSTGLSLVWKLLVLAGTSYLINQWFDINVLFYIIFLFFSLFSLSFIAIYMAHSSNLDKQPNGSST